MRVNEIRKLETSKLMTEITKTRTDLIELRRGVASGENTNVRVVRSKRKQLAKMLTIASEKLNKETG